MNTEYWEKSIETLPRQELEKLQLERIKSTLTVASNAPYYKDQLQKHNISPDAIRCLDDFRKLPFTTKADMRANYPFGLLAGNLEDAVRIHSSSGTTGIPTVIIHSPHHI
jgi:phenylacetate-CoA ligase